MHSIHALPPSTQGQLDTVDHPSRSDSTSTEQVLLSDFSHSETANHFPPVWKNVARRSGATACRSAVPSAVPSLGLGRRAGVIGPGGLHLPADRLCGEFYRRRKCLPRGGHVLCVRHGGRVRPADHLRLLAAFSTTVWRRARPAFCGEWTRRDHPKKSSNKNKNLFFL